METVVKRTNSTIKSWMAKQIAYPAKLIIPMAENIG